MFTAKAVWSARTGLLVANGVELPTPNFVAPTSRGALPHLTPDFGDVPRLAGLYAEDVWDQSGLVPACATRAALPLRSPLLVAGVRRPGCAPIRNKPNTESGVAISTAQGSQTAALTQLGEFVRLAAPDILVVPYDMPAARDGPAGGNRVRKMERRTAAWTRALAAEARQLPRAPLVALALPPELRTREYLLEVDALCDAYSFAGGVAPLPGDSAKLRLSAGPFVSWARLVGDVLAGADLVHTDFTLFADRGLALTLSFAADTPEYVDLNDERYTEDTGPFHVGGFMPAYVHHLLAAREMTAQVVLQRHNFAVLETLFADMRAAIAAGSFTEQARAFVARYGDGPVGDEQPSCRPSESTAGAL